MQEVSPALTWPAGHQSSGLAIVIPSPRSGTQRSWWVSSQSGHSMILWSLVWVTQYCISHSGMGISCYSSWERCCSVSCSTSSNCAKLIHEGAKEQLGYPANFSTAWAINKSFSAIMEPKPGHYMSIRRQGTWPVQVFYLPNTARAQRDGLKFITDTPSFFPMENGAVHWEWSPTEQSNHTARDMETPGLASRGHWAMQLLFQQWPSEAAEWLCSIPCQFFSMSSQDLSWES